MTEVPGAIRFTRILEKVPRRGGINDQTTVGLSTTAIFSAFAGYFSDTLEMGPALIYGDMQSLVGFSVIPKCVTLNVPVIGGD